MANLMNDHLKALINANQKMLDELLSNKVIKTTQKINSLIL